MYVTFVGHMIAHTYEEIRTKKLMHIYKVYIGFLSRASSNEENDVIGTRKPTSIPTEGSKNAYSYSGCVCCLLSSGLCIEFNKVNDAVE